MQFKLSMTQMRRLLRQHKQRTLSELLDKRIKDLDNSIISKKAKAYVSYKVPTQMKYQFMRVSPRDHYLIVRLAIPNCHVQDQRGLCRMESSRWRTNVTAVNFTSEKELDYIMRLVKQAYDYNLILPRTKDRRKPMAKKDYQKYCNVRVRADYALKVKQLSQIRMTKQSRICEALFMLPSDEILIERMTLGRQAAMDELRLGKEAYQLGHRTIALTEDTYRRVKTIAEKTDMSIAQFVTMVFAVEIRDLEHYIDTGMKSGLKAKEEYHKAMPEEPVNIAELHITKDNVGYTVEVIDDEGFRWESSTTMEAGSIEYSIDKHESYFHWDSSNSLKDSDKRESKPFSKIAELHVTKENGEYVVLLYDAANHIVRKKSRVPMVSSVEYNIHENTVTFHGD